MYSLCPCLSPLHPGEEQVGRSCFFRYFHRIVVLSWSVQSACYAWPSSACSLPWPSSLWRCFQDCSYYCKVEILLEIEVMSMKTEGTRRNCVQLGMMYRHFRPSVSNDVQRNLVITADSAVPRARQCRHLLLSSALDCDAKRSTLPKINNSYIFYTIDKCTRYDQHHKFYWNLLVPVVEMVGTSPRLVVNW